MKSNALDATDTMVGWMRQVNKRLMILDRVGRTDLLNSTPEADAAMAGELTVRNMEEIPESLPPGSPVFVLADGLVYKQDPTTMEWQPAP